VEIAGKRHLAILPLGKNLNPSQNATATLITTRVSQIQESVKLVVVMSAVNLWKP
jgi:hypothetical protein